MKHLYIVRGPFGTGKTEFAKSLSENVISCWDYYAKYGENKWNEKLKPHADEYCRNSVVEMMQQDECQVFVTNSFSKNSDLDFYYQQAEKYGYKVFSIVMDCRDAQEFKRNAPQDVVLKQIINIKNNVPFHQGF